MLEEMQIKTEFKTEIDDLDMFVQSPFDDVLTDLNPTSSEFLPSDDIWKKFEIDFPEFVNFDDIFNELCFSGDVEDSLLSMVAAEGAVTSEIRNHDCMWAGHCASSEHPHDDSSHNKKAPLVPTPPVIAIKSQQQQTPTPGLAKTPAAVSGGHHQQNKASFQSTQQSLLKSSFRQTAVAAPAQLAVTSLTPQTPPMSDDEEKGIVHTDPQLLRLPEASPSGGTTEEYEDDDDLSEYFRSGSQTNKQQRDGDEDDDDSEETSEESSEEEEDEDEEQQQSTSYTMVYRQPVHYAYENDHSYHKDKNASMRVANLGIETPSDSEEEEIDVVSVDKKFSVNNRIACSLPTNPSKSDRRHLQRTMKTAINNPRMLPAKRPQPSPSYTPTKRRIAQTSAARAPRQYRINRTPYRRKNYGNSSESDTEPSEKRSLHNNMERQRRIDLRNAFEDLRKLVPEVLKKERAPKVVILREAAKYCDNLTYSSMSHTRQVEDLKRHQERLRNRVSMLRRSLAQKR